MRANCHVLQRMQIIRFYIRFQLCNVRFQELRTQDLACKESDPSCIMHAILAPRSPTEETRQRGGAVLRSKSKETGEKTVSTSLRALS